MTAHRLRKDDQAETGIGTMIVFIAAVLVAAIAAGVLINTSGKLQEKSSRTGDEATQQVASNLQVQDMVGRRDTVSETGLNDLDIYVQLAPGANDIDLSELRLQISNGTMLETLSYVNGAADATHFSASAIRDADGSFSAANPVMSAGDLVKLSLDLTAAALEFEPRENVRVVLLPEIGSSVVDAFTTPNSYGTQTIVGLN